MNAHMHANRSDASATNFMPGRSLLLQHQCACGSSAGTTGECAACANKRRLQAKLSIGRYGVRLDLFQRANRGNAYTRPTDLLFRDRPRFLCKCGTTVEIEGARIVFPDRQQSAMSKVQILGGSDERTSQHTQSK